MPGGPGLLFGGTSRAALRRIASRGAGWNPGDATVQDVRDFAPRLRRAWQEAGRTGSPRPLRRRSGPRFPAAFAVFTMSKDGLPVTAAAPAFADGAGLAVFA